MSMVMRQVAGRYSVGQIPGLQLYLVGSEVSCKLMYITIHAIKHNWSLSKIGPGYIKDGDKYNRFIL